MLKTERIMEVSDFFLFSFFLANDDMKSCEGRSLYLVFRFSGGVMRLLGRQPLVSGFITVRRAAGLLVGGTSLSWVRRASK